MPRPGEASRPKDQAHGLLRRHLKYGLVIAPPDITGGGLILELEWQEIESRPRFRENRISAGGYRPRPSAINKTRLLRFVRIGVHIVDQVTSIFDGHTQFVRELHHAPRFLAERQKTVAVGFLQLD